MADDSASLGLSAPLEHGVWKGWSVWTGNEPFEDYAGPFYTRRHAEGSYVCGFRPGRQNLNGAGVVHGGAIATFADYSLFMIAHDTLKAQPAVTVTLSIEFVGAGPADILLLARGDVVRAGKSLVFVRGIVSGDDEPVANFSGVLKLLRAKPSP